MTKIIGLANSCKECPNRHYFSGGAYECMKVQGSRLNADSTIPTWCPLPDYPKKQTSDRVSQVATVVKDVIETFMLWNGQASAGLDINGLAGLRDELVALAASDSAEGGAA